MKHEYILWISLFAYAFHIFEEKIFNWKYWAESSSGLKGLTWTDFYVANAAVVVTGLSAAMVGWRLPGFALTLPALQLINGIGFHLLPTLLQRRFSPGVITSTFLFLPVALWAYYGAWADGVLTVVQALLSFVIGAIIMTSPFAFLKIKASLNIPDESVTEDESGSFFKFPTFWR